MRSDFRATKIYPYDPNVTPDIALTRANVKNARVDLQSYAQMEEVDSGIITHIKDIIQAA